MRKFKFLFVVAMLSTLFLQSCNSKVDGPSMYSLVTIRESMMSSKWYAVVDNGDKIYPGNLTRVQGYKPVDGQRAMLYFTPMEEKVDGFTYNADVYQIENIPTKNIQVVTETSVLDTLGKARVAIGTTWIGGGYLNSNLILPGTYYTQHYVNLVSNEIGSRSSEDPDYVYLDLFVKVKGSNNDQMGQTPRSICFNLGEYDPKTLGKKGIKLTFVPMQDSGLDSKTITIDLGKEVTEN